jgi:uncharacterized membrane protein
VESPRGTGPGPSPAGSPSLATSGRLERWKATLRRTPQAEVLALVALVAGVVLFTVWWTELNWARFLGFHLSVYDLGVDYQIIWAAAHGYSINEAGPGTTHLLLYIFLIPYWLIPSESGFFLFLLVFETVWLAVGVFPLYWVAKEQTHRRWVGLAFGLAYLAYPAICGPLWFPFHYETLFPTFFLLGYWLYRRGDLRWAAGLWTLSLFTDVGATLIIAALGLGIVGEPLLARTGLWDRLRGRPRTSAAIPRWRWGLGLFLIGAGAAVFLGIAVSYGFWQFVFFTARTSFSSGSTLARAVPFDPFTNSTRKLATIFLLFGPLLALPFWAREERWPLVPYLGPALFTTSFGGFLFPFSDQYTSFVFPVIFVAAIRGLERPWGLRPVRVGEPRAAVTRTRHGRPHRGAISAATGVFLVTVVCASIFAPWGPLNSSLGKSPGLSVGQYDVSYALQTNRSVVADLHRMIDMVPPTGWVLVQNNLPQLLNRTGWTIPGYYTVGQPLDYLINDPYDYNFYNLNSFGPAPASMLSWTNYFLVQGWHVWADADGALLLSASGAGPPAFYDPLVQTFTPSNFLGVGPSLPGHQIFDGPALPIDGAYSVLAPGSYTVTLTLRVDHPRATDQLYFGIGWNYSRVLMENNSILGAPWTATNGTVSLTYPLLVTAYYPGMAFTLYESLWSGSLGLVSIRLAQTAPPAG